MEISKFECRNKHLSLCIFNFDELDLGTQLKAILTSEANETKHPVIASIKSINKSVFEDENIESKLDEINLCPGVSEAKVLPLLSHFGNVNFACIMFLIEMVQKEVIYRSRKCEMVTSEDLCKSCQETFQGLKLDLSARNGKEICSEISLKEECCSDNAEENSTYLACEQVLEEDMMDNYGDGNCDNPYDNLDDVKLEPNEDSFIKKKRMKLKSALIYSCTKCESTFKRLGPLKKHEFIKHKIKIECDECSVAFNDFKTYQKHRHLKSPSIVKSVNCLFCTNRYSSKEGARKHKERYHQEEWEQYKREKKANLLNKTISPKEPIPISEKSKSKLEQDKVQRGTLVPCEVCAQLITKDHLRKHLVNVHKQGSIKKAEHIYPKIPCPHCEKKISSFTLRKHLRIVHNLKGGMGSLEVECNYCLAMVPLNRFEYHTREGCFVRKQKVEINNVK